jgi:hypothetical protein
VARGSFLLKDWEGFGCGVCWDEAVSVAHDARHAVAIEHFVDPGNVSSKGRPKGEDWACVTDFGAIPHAIVEELAHAVPHSVYRSRGVHETFYLDEHTSFTALRKQIDIVVKEAYTALCFDEILEEAKCVLVVATRAFL